MSSLGARAFGGTIHCKRLIASNPSEPHKITGDLEITGDLKVDGGIEVESAGVKGLVLNSNSGVNQVNIEMNENTDTWNISADALTNELSFSHIVNGAVSGSLVGGITFDNSTLKFGAYFPADNGFRLNNIPTSAAGLISGTVWSNGGVLNIVP